MIRQRSTFPGALALLLAWLFVACINAQQYSISDEIGSPSLFDEARMDQIAVNPSPHEVDPVMLMCREVQLECRYAPGVVGMPQTFTVFLEPTGFLTVLTPKKLGLFGGLWTPYTSMLKRTTTGFGMLFRRWKPEAEQDMEFLTFKCDFRPPVFTPNMISFKGGEVWDEEGKTIGRFKVRFPHHRMIAHSSFRAYRSWIKQGFW